MNKWHIISGLLVWGLLGLPAVYGQDIPELPPPSPTAPTTPELNDELLGQEFQPPMTVTPTGFVKRAPEQPSDWMTYRRPYACYCPIGKHGPVQTELYFRIGPSFLVGNDSIYSETLTHGWAFQAGGRVLFFEPSMSKAWALDLSISNNWNQGTNQNLKVPLSIIVPSPAGVPTRVNFGSGPVPGVTVRDYNRTFVNIGLGRYWYLTAPANIPGCKMRWGMDVGGRYGSASAQFHEIKHRTDVVGGMFLGASVDLEVPCGGVALQYGMRTEWAYTWGDILQQTSDVQDINLLFQLGVRY